MTPADLRAARKRLGLTQKGLAEALRMGSHGWQTISGWESDSNERGVPGPAEVAIECLLNHGPKGARTNRVLKTVFKTVRSGPEEIQ